MRAAEGASVFCSSDNIATSVFKLFPSHPRLPIFQRAVLRRSPLVLDWPVDEMLGTRKIVVAWAGHTAHAPPPPRRSRWCVSDLGARIPFVNQLVTMACP